MSAAERSVDRFVKSCYSNTGGNCVEVAPAFVKSSYSNSGGDCVEVASLPDTAVVRDSKRVDGPVLRFPAAAWARLLDETQLSS